VTVGGSGLGYRERPAHNSSNPSSSSATTTAADIIKKGGPGSDRLSAMKTAFRNQYTSQVGRQQL